MNPVGTSLRVEQDGRVRRLTLAEPAKRNLLDAAMAQALLEEIGSAESDPATGAILIDADGPVFCGGVDFAGEIPDAVFTFGQRVTKPIVIAIQGVAISAGVALLANAHVVMAAQGSTFGLTDIREGRSHPGVLAAVARALGERRTRELALTGRVFSMPDALAWGLVHAAVPAFELEDRVSSVATALANADADAVRVVLGR